MFGRLIRDSRCMSTIDMFFDELKKPVKHFKKTVGGRSQVCKAMEERIDKERIDALFNAIKGLMETMKLSAEQAMNAMQISDRDRAILIKRF